MRGIVVMAAAVLALAGAAQAQPVAYSWTGMGTNVQGSSKCPTYKMTIDVTLEGGKVTGRFQQQGRPERHFEATLGADRAFRTKAEVGGGGTMDVIGSLKEGDSTVVLDGYCKFGGTLTKK
jgi:hypothetical protein